MADGNLTGLRRRPRNKFSISLPAAVTDPEVIGGADPDADSGVSLAYQDDYASGGLQSLTTSLAALLPGGATPVVVLDKAGTYLLFGHVVFDAAGATVTTQTIAFQLYRNNNTPTAVVNSAVGIDLPVMTTLTFTLGAYHLPVVKYTTTVSNDEIVIAGLISANLSVGTIDATSASIFALKIS